MVHAMMKKWDMKRNGKIAETISATTHLFPKAPPLFSSELDPFSTEEPGVELFVLVEFPSPSNTWASGDFGDKCKRSEKKPNPKNGQ